MRPRSYIQSVVLYNERDKDGDYIPLKIELNSWVALHSDELGGTSINGAYKARVCEFEVKGGVVTQIRVQHAYMRRELRMHPVRHVTQSSACNCKISATQFKL